MRAFLMFRDRDFDPKQPLPANEEALRQDLGLETLFTAMSGGDEFLHDVAKGAVLSSLSDPAAILYRQDILKDCLRNPSIAHDIYGIAAEAVEGEKESYWGLVGGYPTSVLRRSADVMAMFMARLKRLTGIGEAHAGRFASDGFRTLFTRLESELGEAYFTSVEELLHELEFRQGVTVSAELGRGNKGIHYVLRRPAPARQSLVDRVLAKGPPAYSFRIAERDDADARALSEMRDRGLATAANALAQAVDHVLAFFQTLRAELAFYMGCLNLHDRLKAKGEPMAFPTPAPAGERFHTFRGLYDVCLALNTDRRVVGNEMKADGKDLVVVTGANQGGKSTFLRSLGLVQLMMQCGLFAAAACFHANVSTGLFTHFRREEDDTMKSGKFDEELARLDGIVDQLSPNAMVLFNESFAATNEREGSEIARQIILALTESGIKVAFVTHLYEFARGLFEKGMDNAIFLRAERKAGGERTFKLVEGEPLQTSFGKDIYDQVFGTGAGGPRAGEPETG